MDLISCGCPHHMPKVIWAPHIRFKILVANTLKNIFWSLRTLKGNTWFNQKNVQTVLGTIFSTDLLRGIRELLAMPVIIYISRHHMTEQSKMGDSPFSPISDITVTDINWECQGPEYFSRIQLPCPVFNQFSSVNLFCSSFYPCLQV